MAHIFREPSTTFDEWLLEPSETKKHSLESIVLRSPLARFNNGLPSNLILNIPMMSAAMQAVTGPRLAISLAREGGIGVVYCSQPIESQAAMVEEVKNYKAGFVQSDSNVTPETSLEDALSLSRKTGHSTVAVTQDGTPNGRLMGLLTDNDYWVEFDNPVMPVKDYMTPFTGLFFGRKGISLSEANALLRQHKKSCLPIIDGEDRLCALVFKRDYQAAKEFPFSLVDINKRFKVAAAINTRDYQDRVPALMNAGADVVVFDSSDGYSVYQKEAIEWVKQHFPESVVGGGNVVNREGFQYLVEAGADFVKVGIGGGSICTTREMKAIGRGQADAVMDIAAFRDEFFKKTGAYIPLISDGGIVYDNHIMLALAIGADAVMMGRYFAMTDESPTQVRDMGGQFFKPYWGEGSSRARNWQRYHMDLEDALFEEGIEGYVPLAGSLSNKVRLTLSKLRSTMSNCGVSSIREFHEGAVIRRVSQSTLKESSPHDVLRFEWALQDRETRR